MAYRDKSFGESRPLTDSDFLISRVEGFAGRPEPFSSRKDDLPLEHYSSSLEDGPQHNRKQMSPSDLKDSSQMELKPFLDRGSTPGWDSTNSYVLPNIKILSSKRASEESPPKDRLNLVFLIFMLHGVGTLIPWNMFITAKSYFVDYKLAVNVTGSSTEEYKSHFISYLGVASQVPNVICNACNTFVYMGGENVTFRIIGSIVVEIVIFILTVILATVDSSSWPGTFFYVTMSSVVVLNMVNGVYQNSLYGLAAKLPMKYSQAVLLGANTSGTFATLLSILSIALSPSERTAAIYYFITALFVLLACIDTYFALPLINYYRFYERKVQKAVAKKSASSRKVPFWKVFKKTSVQCFNVFFIFFVTLTIFPAIHSDIKPMDPDFVISQKYFTPVTCFLVFNFCAMLGSLLPSWVIWPSQKYLWIPVLCRAVLIPCFMLCNYIPDRRQIPVFITNDWAYVGLGVILGISGGYLSSLAMMYAPKCVATEHAEVAGMLAALFLVLGIFCGVNFTFFVSWLVESKLF